MSNTDSTQLVQRSYRLRIYPNATQRRQLAIEFGCARWIWNTCLDARSSAYRWYGQSVNQYDLSKAITEVKADPDFAWLSDASAVCGQQVLRDLDRAFANFFEGRARYPRFKKKTGRQSVRYTLDAQRLMCVPGEWLKLSKLGRVKVRWSRVPGGVPKMVTVSLSPSGEYHVSFMVKESVDRWPSTGHTVGVDVGIKDVAVTSDGWHSGAPRSTYRLARKLRHEQRALARKKKGSRRRARQMKKVAKVHDAIAKCRSDFLHKLTTKIVRENDVICIEDLNVAGMLKNRRLSKAVSDVGMGELRRQIEYKAAWHGRTVVAVDRWFPSTKMCSGCGQVHDIPLSKRRMECDCGIDMDRDHNAAVNIAAEGVWSLSGVSRTEHVEGEINSAPGYAVVERLMKRADPGVIAACDDRRKHQESYLARSEGVAPSPVLVAYYESATRVYDAMVDIYSRLDDGEIVPTKDLSDYMSLVLRLAIAFA